MDRKNTKPTKEELIKSMMSEIGRNVSGVLEKFSGNSSASHLNEMARSQVERAVDSKALANVRDAAQRRKYNREWAINAQPLPKLMNDEYQLLHRYVAALLIYEAPCPETEEQIDEIGIFKNYAHAFLDENAGTLEEIQTLYNKNSKITKRERKGSKRAIKGFRDSDVARQNGPGAILGDDFDFDKEAAASTPVPQPEQVDDNNDDFDFDNRQPVENEPEYPSYDEVSGGADDDETPIEDVEKPVDDEDELDNAGDDETIGGSDEDDNAPVDEPEDLGVERMEDITYEQYYNPALNRAFSNTNDDFIKLNEDGKIGIEMSVEERDTHDKRVFFIWADSFGKLLEHYDIVSEASILNLSDKFFRIRTSPVVTKWWKQWREVGIPTDEADDQLEDNISDFYFRCIGNVKDIDQLVENIQNMDY